MFKFKIEAETYAELQEKLLEVVSKLTPSVTPDEKPTYDTTEEDEMLDEVYVHPVASVEDVPPIKEFQPEESHHAGSFEMSPSSTDGITGEDNELDSKGMPYNSKIHSATKAVNKDGSWRYRRGVDEAKIKEVEAKTSAQPAVKPGIPPMPSTTVDVPPVSFTQPQVQQPVQAPVAAPVTQSPQPQAQYESIPVPQNSTKPAHTLDTFAAGFIQTMSNLAISGAINQEYINSLKNHFQVKEIWDVMKNPGQVAEVFDTLVEYGLITKVG